MDLSGSCALQGPYGPRAPWGSQALSSIDPLMEWMEWILCGVECVGFSFQASAASPGSTVTHVILGDEEFFIGQKTHCLL